MTLIRPLPLGTTMPFGFSEDFRTSADAGATVIVIEAERAVLFAILSEESCA
ncbi:hypothetical protein D3C79_1092710 [compost metagenome]